MSLGIQAAGVVFEQGLGETVHRLQRLGEIVWFVVKQTLES